MSTVRRLPGPLADNWDWQLRGACRGRDATQFFHPEGERGSARTRREEAAKRLCHSCVVRVQCAAHALLVQEPYGVWGGFTENERQRLLAAGGAELVDRRTGHVDVALLDRWLRHPAGPLVVPRPRSGEPARVRAA